MVKEVNCVLEEKYKVNISHFFWNELMIRNFTFLKSVKSSTKLVYCLIYSLTQCRFTMCFRWVSTFLFYKINNFERLLN